MTQIEQQKTDPFLRKGLGLAWRGWAGRGLAWHGAAGRGRARPGTARGL